MTRTRSNRFGPSRFVRSPCREARRATIFRYSRLLAANVPTSRSSAPPMPAVLKTRAPTRGMRVRIDPPELRDDLLEFLRASSCLGVKHGSSEIEAHLLNRVSERHDRAVLAR